MSAMASQITSLTIVYSTVYSGVDQRKHQSSASLAFVRGIHRWPVNSLHKSPVTRKMFPFDDVIMPEIIGSQCWYRLFFRDFIIFSVWSSSTNLSRWDIDIDRLVQVCSKCVSKGVIAVLNHQAIDIYIYIHIEMWEISPYNDAVRGVPTFTKTILTLADVFLLDF